MRAAVMTGCCKKSACDSCMRTAFVVKSKCPLCDASVTADGNLFPNAALRKAIQRFRHEDEVAAPKHDTAEKSAGKAGTDTNECAASSKDGRGARTGRRGNKGNNNS